MKWIRNLFARPQLQRRLPASRQFRPELDELEDRRLPNVSAVFSKTGGLNTFIVDQDGTLTRIAKGTPQVLNIRPGLPAGVTVRAAHGYLDAKGKVGVDVVYTDGQAWKSDSLGTGFVADKVLNMNTVVTARGVTRVYFLFADPAATAPFGPNLLGTLVVRIKGVDSTLDTNVRWVSAFVDATGKIGVVTGKVQTAAPGHLVVTKFVGASSATLYNAPNGATQDLTWYSQTSFNGKTVFDVTFGRFAGTYALRFQGGFGSMLGTGTSIKLGG